jgi:ectoine hydroxylase
MSKRAQAGEWARRLKPVAAARTLGHPRELARNRARYQELGLRKLPFAGVRHAEVSGKGGPAPWLDQEPVSAQQIEAAPGYSELPEQARAGVLEWPQRGYLVLEQFFDEARVDAINDDVDRLLGGGDLHFHYRSRRVMNSWRKSEAVAELNADPELARILDFILGRPAKLFQTISFVTGSQQSAHSDAFHMMTEPPGFLIGVWVALEDIDEGAGPVFYLPGSHKLPYTMSEDLELAGAGGGPLTVPDKGRAYVSKMTEVVRDFEADPVPFTASKGDVLLWHHNLMHGGQPITREGATRKSLVAHFFADGVLCYHEVTERPALMPDLD